MHPLSAHERTALIQILGASAQDAQTLGSRQRAALDAYLFVLSHPPLDPREVLAAARALIRTWAEVRVANSPIAPLPRKPSERRSAAIQATLLDQEVCVSDGTEQLSPMALSAVFESYGYR